MDDVSVPAALVVVVMAREVRSKVSVPWYHYNEASVTLAKLYLNRYSFCSILVICHCTTCRHGHRQARLQVAAPPHSSIALTSSRKQRQRPDSWRRLFTISIDSPSPAAMAIMSLSTVATMTAIAAILLLYVVSTAVYRLFLSPIAKFPGPRLAALTFWYVHVIYV